MQAVATTGKCVKNMKPVQYNYKPTLRVLQDLSTFNKIKWF